MPGRSGDQRRGVGRPISTPQATSSRPFGSGSAGTPTLRGGCEGAPPSPERYRSRCDSDWPYPEAFSTAGQPICKRPRPPCLPRSRPSVHQAAPRPPWEQIVAAKRSRGRWDTDPSSPRGHCGRRESVSQLPNASATAEIPILCPPKQRGSCRNDDWRHAHARATAGKPIPAGRNGLPGARWPAPARFHPLSGVRCVDTES